MTRSISRRLFVAIWILVAAVGSVTGRATGVEHQPLSESDSTKSKSDLAGLTAPTIGFLFQVDGYAESRVFEKGFVTRASRVMVSGKGGRFSYFAQANLLTDQTLLDMRLRVLLSDRIELEGGLGKTPFSSEFMRFRGDLPLAEPSRIVVALAPKRQVGATLTFDLGPTTLRGGLYNGNWPELTNDGPGFMTVARLEHHTEFGSHDAPAILKFGVNGAFSQDDDARIPGIFTNFAGRRMVGGADFDLSVGNWWMSAEANIADLQPVDDESAAVNPFGYVLTTGYLVPSGHRLTGRVDYFDTDLDEEGSVVLVGGYAFEALPRVRLSAEYRFDVTNARTNAVLVRFQVARK